MKKGTIFYRKKMSRETILTIVYLFLTGYPISNMPPLVHVTEGSIRNLLEAVITRFKKYEALIVAPSDYIPKIIEIDEIYIKIQGNREFYGWLAYDAENKYLIDFVTGKRDDDTLEKVFKKLKKYKGKTELVLIGAYKGYGKFIEKYLADGGKKPLTGVINKSQYSKTEGFVTYALFGQSKQSVEDRMASLGLGGENNHRFDRMSEFSDKGLVQLHEKAQQKNPKTFKLGRKSNIRL